MDIHKQVDALLVNVDLSAPPTIEEQVCRFLAITLGDSRWLGCALQQFVLPNGTVAYSAAIVCDRCRLIHQWIVVPDQIRGFLVATPTPLEEDE